MDDEVRGTAEMAGLMISRRKQLGLSRQDVANAVGCTYNYIAKVELGLRKPTTPEMHKAFAEVLRVDEDEVYAASGTLPADIVSHMEHVTAEQLKRVREVMITT